MLATRPDIDTVAITRTLHGIDVIDLKTLLVNYKTCQRCPLCYEACQENAISVKGYSGARRLP
jgi:NAD-dependent dihydropyrimidine dehydrogenase PreA subunit